MRVYSEVSRSAYRGLNVLEVEIMRIQLDLDDTGVELLDRLEKATGSRTHKEFFNNAITLMDWAVRQRQAGRIIASMDERDENYKELQMPALENAANANRESVGSTR
jgi:hypothetical protein